MNIERNGTNNIGFFTAFNIGLLICNGTKRSEVKLKRNRTKWNGMERSETKRSEVNPIYPIYIISANWNGMKRNGMEWNRTIL